GRPAYRAASARGDGGQGGWFSIKPGEMNEIQLDFLKELENIGAANAATALAGMLNRPIDIRVPNAWFCSIEGMGTLLGDAEQIMTGSLVEMSGDITGAILFVQPLEDSIVMSDMLVEMLGVENDKSIPFPSDLQHSALTEIANILCGSYINAVASLTGLYINCSVPGLVIDMAGALMNLPAVMYGASGDTILMLETVLVDSDKYVSGRFFLMPDIESQTLMMQKMGLL
ncbi:MAG TPA: chemotaxis protein CheC, partial [Feifaniaceae bacterium]|nr:chemotaxis protein CheC [Feifaniaceae bacterium]